MNNFIKILVTAIVALLSVNGQCQKTESLTVKLSDPLKPGKLDIELFFGSIKVIAYPGKEVLVSATPYYPANRDQKKDMDAMKDSSNKALNLDISQKNNVVKIIVEKPRVMNFVIKVPENFSVALKILTAGDIAVENVKGNHEVSITSGNITMSGIIGSVSANTKNGNITVDMNPGKINTPSAFSNVMGIIDVRFSAGIKANVKLQTEFGAIHSDFVIVKDAAAAENDKKTAVGKINGGGSEIFIKTVGGNIFVRKRN